MQCLDFVSAGFAFPGLLLPALKCISAVEGNGSKDPMAAHRLDDVKADVGEDPLHVVVDRLPVLLDVPVPWLVH